MLYLNLKLFSNKKKSQNFISKCSVHKHYYLGLLLEGYFTKNHNF